MAVKRIIYAIDRMECPNCAMILERIEDKIAGVRRAEASYHKAQLLVEFDDAQVSDEKIQMEIKRLGYTTINQD